MDEQKRNALINAGFEEFSIHGKDRASLNNILKKSKLSKGVFYHYFESKDDLYVFLIRYAGKHITKDLEEESLMDERDFINRIIKSFYVKANVFRNFVYFADFLIRVYQENEVDWVQQIINKENNNYERRVISENIDFDLFKTNDNMANLRLAGR